MLDLKNKLKRKKEEFDEEEEVDYCEIKKECLLMVNEVEEKHSRCMQQP